MTPTIYNNNNVQSMIAVPPCRSSHKSRHKHISHHHNKIDHVPAPFHPLQYPPIPKSCLPSHTKSGLPFLLSQSSFSKRFASHRSALRNFHLSSLPVGAAATSRASFAARSTCCLCASTAVYPGGWPARALASHWACHLRSACEGRCESLEGMMGWRVGGLEERKGDGWCWCW